MYKERLRQLKRINATPKMIKLAENNNKKMTYKCGWRGELVLNTEYDLFVRCQSRGSILMICLFLPQDIQKGNKCPSFEIYCNVEGDEFITRKIKNDKEIGWSEAKIYNLGAVWNTLQKVWGCEGSKKRVWMNRDTQNTIKSMLKTDKSGLEGIWEWQNRARERNRIKAEKRQQAPWDADMALVPDVCPSFAGWMQKEGPDQYFIFYKYDKKGATEGYCSHCMRRVPIIKPKHNKDTKCKLCGISAKFKADTRVQTLTTTMYYGSIVQKVKGGIVIRTYEGKQWYRGQEVYEPYVAMREIERVLVFNDGHTKRYQWGLYKNKEYRWIPGDVTYTFNTGASLYKRNFSQLKKSVLKHTTLDYWKKLPCGVSHYIAIEKSNKCIEKLVKIGMFTLAKEMIYMRADELLNDEATELSKMLKIDKQRLQRLKKMDGGKDHLEWLQHEKDCNKAYKDEMINEFAESGIGPKDFDFLPVANVSYEKIWNYLKKQSVIIQGPLSWTKRTWKDYLNMAKRADLNVKSDMIWKPKNLYAAHQEVILLLQKEKLEEQAAELAKKWTKVNDILPNLSKFEYADDKYAIVTPRAIIDIVKEGTSLQHCVHTCDFYFDRIQKNESYLFFLRRAESPSSSWYTLEVEPSGNIRQKRTTGDNQDKDLDEAIIFLKEWQKFFKTKMTEEEKEFGIKADEARKKEYAKLRQDGNKVWHGKLAGKLLADVLEDDFLAAI